MNIQLPTDANQFIEGMVASGQYASVNDAIADGSFDRKTDEANLTQGDYLSPILFSQRQAIAIKSPTSQNLVENYRRLANWK